MTRPRREGGRRLPSRGAAALALVVYRGGGGARPPGDSQAQPPQFDAFRPGGEEHVAAAAEAQQGEEPGAQGDEAARPHRDPGHRPPTVSWAADRPPVRSPLAHALFLLCAPARYVPDYKGEGGANGVDSWSTGGWPPEGEPAPAEG